MKTILEDDRPIKTIHFEGTNPGTTAVGVGCVTKIEAYPEPGLHCSLPWIAVYEGDEITVRVPATAVSIIYDIQ